MPSTNILILGGGICGVASAIAISSAFSSSSSSSSSPLSIPASDLNITIFELRKEPSTIGGAVNLTPNAVRGLDILGVLDELKTRRAGCEVSSIQLFSLHTGSSLGTIDYAGPEGTGHGGYRGRRVMRSELLQALLAVAQKLENVRVVYGKKVAGLTESSEAVTVAFEDGTDAKGDLVLGCDGIHSTTRMQFIEPDRIPTYSGVASAYGFANLSDVLDSGSGAADEGMFFTDTALAMSRRGAFLMTYCDDARQRIYVSALMETAQQVSKEGWRALGEDREAIKRDVVRRFETSALPHMKELVHSADEWFFYPIYRLSPQGKWCTDRVMLLGDAAHAMPPRGESIGYALEDAIIFSRVLSHFGLTQPPATTFSFYEKIRRNPIDAAYRDASMGWESNKDSGFWVTKFMEWITPLYLWWTRNSREKTFRADPRDIDFS